MSLRRVAVLLVKEFRSGIKNFIFIFALVIPIGFSLVLNLLFGTFFSGKPKLGVADMGNSDLVTQAQAVDSIIVNAYESDAALREAVQSGAVDLGLTLPANFDTAVQTGESVEIEAYIWGESLMQDRAILGTSIAVWIRTIAGQEKPVEIVTTTLGDETAVPWEVRLLPFVVLITIMIGGIMVPATSLVEEKMKRTLTAVTTTPTSLGEVYTAKALLGIILGVVMGVVILTLNRAFGSQPLLLMGLLALGGTMASIFGILLGILIKDINSLFATIKGIGILLYAPAIVYLFPTLPQWVARIFPTYYIIGPIMDVTQKGATFGDVAPEVAILLAIILLLVGVVAILSRRAREGGALVAA
ncbi:MAG: ABC transporter permease [Ardenticatenaceae bacterium]|nr:ABC transporter permease [Anaerolineales bacterium]MCB8978567.1 ABC transporter permease [Ardenticatenaceae bacterium]